MAEVTLSLNEYHSLLNARTAAENEAAALRTRLAEAQAADPSGVVPELVRGLRAARALMPYAMMFIPHEKMPREAILTLASVYEGMPGATEDDRVVAIDWRHYAEEISSYGKAG